MTTEQLKTAAVIFIGIVFLGVMIWSLVDYGNWHEPGDDDWRDEL